jgi:hypothetical protein
MRAYFFLRPNCWTVSVRPPALTVPLRVPFDRAAATTTDSVALPVPLVGPTEIQLTAEPALQAHEASEAVRVAASVVAAPETVTLPGVSVNVHPGGTATAGWVIVTALPATTKLAVRCELVPFAATVTVTAPEPVPEACDAVAQDWSDETPHAHDVSLALMLMPTLSPLAGEVWDAGVTANVHTGAAATAAWVIVTTLPPTTKLAVR